MQRLVRTSSPSDMEMSLRPPSFSGEAIVIKNMPRHLHQVHCR